MGHDGIYLAHEGGGALRYAEQRGRIGRDADHAYLYELPTLQDVMAAILDPLGALDEHAEGPEHSTLYQSAGLGGQDGGVVHYGLDP